MKPRKEEAVEGTDAGECVVEWTEGQRTEGHHGPSRRVT